MKLSKPTSLSLFELGGYYNMSTDVQKSGAFRYSVTKGHVVLNISEDGITKLVGETITFSGTIDSDKDMTVDMLFQIKKKSDDSVVSTIFDSSISLTTGSNVFGPYAYAVASLGDFYAYLEISGSVVNTNSEKIFYKVIEESLGVVQIDADISEVEVVVGDNLDITGSFESDGDYTTTLSVTVHKKSDDSLIATLFSGSLVLTTGSNPFDYDYTTAEKIEQYVKISLSGSEINSTEEKLFFVCVSGSITLNPIINSVIFNLGDTVTITGTIVSDGDYTVAASLTIHKKSDDSLLETVFDDDINLTTGSNNIADLITNDYITTTCCEQYVKLSVSESEDKMLFDVLEAATEPIGIALVNKSETSITIKVSYLPTGCDSLKIVKRLYEQGEQDSWITIATETSPELDKQYTFTLTYDEAYEIAAYSYTESGVESDVSNILKILCVEAQEGFIDVNWTKWICASINTHFSDIGIKVFIEGEKHETEQDWVDLKIVGPNYFPSSKNVWEAEVSVFAVVVSLESKKDAYKMLKNKGIVEGAFSNINIYKYGDGDAFLDCLTLISPIKSKNIGQEDKEIKSLKQVIYADYKIVLEKE